MVHLYSLVIVVFLTVETYECASNVTKRSFTLTPPVKNLYPKLSKRPVLSKPILKANTFVFVCNIIFDPSRTDVGFHVFWLFDGFEDKAVPPITLTGSQRHAELDQRYLNGLLGKTVACSVESFWKTTPAIKGKRVDSNRYWCGIKFSPSVLTFDSSNSSPQTVSMIMTVPMVCTDGPRFCTLEIYLGVTDISSATRCTQVFNTSSWNPHRNEAVTSFKVSPIPGPRLDIHYIVKFQPIFSVDAPPIFNSYPLPYISVHLKQTRHATCTCTGDMYCTTLDTNSTKTGSSYSLQLDGIFMMYESTKRPFQVELHVEKCHGNVCACGVAAREGNEIVIIDKCQRRFPVVTTRHIKGVVVARNTTGEKYLIDFPSGAQIRVEVVSHALSISVTAPDKDFGATRGLCGTFDNNRNNDLTHFNGMVDSFPVTGAIPTSFAESWRIATGHDLIALKDTIPINSKYDIDIHPCSCNQGNGEIVCDFNAHSNSTAVHVSFDRFVCKAVTNLLSERLIVNTVLINDDDINRLI